MTDAETTAAIKALVHRVKARDQAIREGQDHPDAEPFALEYVTALLGNGWRHLEALAKPKPAPDGTPAPDARRSAELLAPLRAQLDEINAARKVVRDETQAGAA